MIDLSQESIRARDHGGAQLARVNMYFSDLSSMEIPASSIMTYEYNAQCVSKESFAPGAVAASSITMQVWNDGQFKGKTLLGAEFVVYDAYVPYGDDPIQWIQRRQRYTVLDAVDTNSEIIEFTGYDALYLTASEWTGSATAGTKLSEMVEHVVSDCNLTMTDYTWPLNNYELGRDIDLEDMTNQQVLSLIAEISGCYVRVKNNREIVFVRLGRSQDTVDLGVAFDSLDVQPNDVSITQVRVKALGTESDYGETWTVGYSDDYVLEIDQNELVTENKAQEVAESLWDTIGNTTLRPMQAKVLPDLSLEVGDYFVVYGGNNTRYRGIATKINYVPGALMVVDSTAESAPMTKLNSYSSNSIIRRQAGLATEKRFGNVEKAQEYMSQLAANTLGFYSTAEVQDDGSTIQYWHDKPTLADSSIVYKQGIDGFFISNDGGDTWIAGRDSQGNEVVNILSAIGINAEWLDIDQVIERINEDSTTSIDSVHVTVDGESLHAVFESVSSSANEANSKAEDAAADAERALAEVKIVAEGLSATVVNEMIASDEWATLQQQITNVTQTANGVTVTVASIEKSVDQIVQDFYTYFVLAQEGLYIRKEGSEFETLLANDRLSFIQGGNEIAYISSNRLYITDAWIKNSLSIENATNGTYVRHYVDEQGFYNIKIIDSAIDE